MWKQTGADPSKLASDDDREYVEQRVRDLLRRAVTHAEQSSNGWGCVPSAIRAAIKGWLQGEVDWRKVLEMWVNGRIRGEQHSTIRRLNRRYPMVHPGQKRNHRPLLLIAKDQSGSVSDEAVALFYGELANLSKSVDFDQVAFDTQCGEVERWHRGSLPEPTRERCGGTDFDVITRLVEHPDNRARWDGLLMLTDGKCSKPSPSLVPRVWIICPGHKLMFEPDAGELIITLDGDRRDDAGVLG
jgi:predicted metal-dependent peptidase